MAAARDATRSVPNEDDPWSVADVLAEMMAGAYDHGSCVEIYGYQLYDRTRDESGPNVWTVHPPANADEDRAIDVLNLDQFRTASEIESYLLEGDRE